MYKRQALASQLADTRLVLLDSRTFGAGKRNGDAPYYVTVALDPTFTLSLIHI